MEPEKTVAPDTAPRNILFCTDFSENADFAFHFAVAAARAHPGAALHVLHVIPEPEAQFWKTYIYEVDDVDAKAKHDIDARIEAYRRHLPENLSLQLEFRIGRDANEILAFIEESDIDLVVMGRQGRSGIEKILFGNVTEKIARRALCPVLIVPWSYRDVLRAREG